MTAHSPAIISGWQFLKVEHSHSLDEQKAQQYQLHTNTLHPFKCTICTGCIQGPQHPSLLPFQHPWYSSHSQACTSPHSWAQPTAAPFHSQTRQYKQNLCFLKHQLSKGQIKVLPSGLILILLSVHNTFPVNYLWSEATKIKFSLL